MTELDIDSIALEAAQDVARISRSMPVGGHSQMVAQMQCRIIEAITVAKRAVLGSAEPVYFIRPHNFAWTNPEHNSAWCEASEDAYHHTLAKHRRICYTAPPAPVSAEPVNVQVVGVRNDENQPQSLTSSEKEVVFKEALELAISAIKEIEGEDIGTMVRTIRALSPIPSVTAEFTIIENQLDDLTEHRLRSILREIGMDETANSVHLAADLHAILGQMRHRFASQTTDAKDSERIPTRGELLHKLYHHQGGSSPIGQPIRALLGIGQHAKLTKAQLAEIKAYAAIAAKEAGK